MHPPIFLLSFMKPADSVLQRKKKWLGWLKDLNQMAFGFHEV